ncbi:MAG: translation initiation factor IF-2 [Candidatus Omnitrophota bacterium]
MAVKIKAKKQNPKIKEKSKLQVKQKPRLQKAAKKIAVIKTAAARKFKVNVIKVAKVFKPKPKVVISKPVTKHLPEAGSFKPPVKEEVKKELPVKKEESRKPEIIREEIKKPEIKKEAVPVKEVPPEVVVSAKELRELELKFPITVKDLAIRLQEKSSVLIKALMDMRVMAGINQALNEATVTIICEKFGFKIKHALAEEELALRVHQEIDSPEFLKPRSPIVTMMGHVDHGKTSLLDAIRKTKVVDSEHGGITQHIGAYRVHLSNGDITFLDTPGHEAFTAMRARGAKITDIVILVVAADDGIMPQTKEAIDHARAAGVSIIVAINKIDKPQAQVDQVKKQLSELELLAEDWGGKTITALVSAKTGQGIDNLLEMIILESQMLELKANPNRLAKGVIIDAKMSKGKGPVATLLIQNGTLHLNESIIVGSCYGKIRAMFNHLGQAVTEAPPAYPVEILGLSGMPAAGDQFFVIKDEKQAKELVEIRLEKERLLQIKNDKKISLEDLYSQIKEGKLKELKMIIKADVQGSLAAIKDTIAKINISEIKLDIIHEGVGNINPSDIILAVASNALVLGFNVAQDERAKELSAKEGVDVRLYNIIYELANDIKQAVEGMLEPRLKKVFLGKVEVRKVFKLSRSGTVAGCFVVKGKINRQAVINLVRNGELTFEGKIGNLKRFKDDVREVAEGFECGITLAGFDNLQEGDIIEAYDIEKIARKL